MHGHCLIYLLSPLTAPKCKYLCNRHLDIVKIYEYTLKK